MKTLFKHIMLIDDDYATNYYHKVLIDESNSVAETSFYMYAQDALDFLKKVNEDESIPNIDLIFLDINLPLINGWEFLEELEKIAMDTYPPVIVLSTSNNPADIEKGRQHPLVLEYYSKPFKLEMLEFAHQKIHPKT